jgi:hypothetical protein
MKTVLTPWLRNATIATLLIAPTAFAQTAPAGKNTSSSSTDAKETDVAPSKELCIESHRQCQQIQKEGKLLQARELARICTNLVCPGLLVSDCARWLSDLDQRIPSVVFEVRVDGEPNGEALVFADDKPVGEWTNGESLRLDPGKHQFRFEIPNHEPVTQNLFLGEGMRFRVVSAEFKSPTQASAVPAVTATPASQALTAPPPPRERPTPIIVYPLLGVGVLGAAGFTTFALLGNSKENDLKSSSGCAPNCTESDKKPMKTNYLIADISLGVGVASLITAGVFYFTRPEKETAVPTVAIAPLPGGAAGFVGYHF